MKVLFLHRMWPIYGGGETVTICLANEMVKRGMEIHVAYFHDSDKQLRAVPITSKIDTHHIEHVSFNVNSKDFFISKKESTYISLSLVKLINELNIEIVHNQWWPVDFLKRVHSHTDAKIITCLHMDVDIRKVFHTTGIKQKLLKILYPLYRRIEREKNLVRADKYYKVSDKFVFLSPYFKNKYIQLRKLKQNDPKLKYVYNPLVFTESISNEDWENKEFTVLFVGRLFEKHKQIIRLLSIWKNIQNNSDCNNWKFVLVGEGPDRKLYQDYINRNQLKRVHLEGYQQPLKYYRAASIFCMTSAYEGLPMTLVEAQQNGVVPIVMDTFDSLHDIVENGKNGIIVPNGDINAFENAVVRLICDVKLRKEMSNNGICSCTKFSVQNTVDSWEEIYKETINEKYIYY